jgi:alkylation response protein AidB-like acyl-CoA dehydrogenase
MADKPVRAVMKNAVSAPMIYFDQAPTLGAMHGVIELDLAARVLTPDSGGNVSVDVACVAHLRCSIEAAVGLRAAIDKALAMANVRIADDGANLAQGEDFERRMAHLKTLS